MQRIFWILLFLVCSSVRLSAQEESSADNCIVLMGDSLPAGTFVVELPGTGVTVLQSEPMATLLDDALQAANLLHYGIYDLSLAASAIAAPNSEPYLTSREFFLGRGLNCRYVVIFPFLNDLYVSDDGATGILLYAAGLSTLLNGIQAHSPQSHIILMNYYAATLLGVGDMTYGGDVNAAHVDAMNETHDAHCADKVYVSCLALGEILSPIEDYVVAGISRADYERIGYTVVNPDEQVMLDNYWANRPNSNILGDGLHLNPDGKVAVLEQLMLMFAAIEPEYFAPPLR